MNTVGLIIQVVNFKPLKLVGQYLDVFEIGETRLDHKQRASAIPNGMFCERSLRNLDLVLIP
jgi:hypothetical protein